MAASLPSCFLYHRQHCLTLFVFVFVFLFVLFCLCLVLFVFVLHCWFVFFVLLFCVFRVFFDLSYKLFVGFIFGTDGWEDATTGASAVMPFSIKNNVPRCI